MSASPSPSPCPGPAPPRAEERDLPKGHCRYILLQDQIKGQRCACVNFVRNQTVPGTTCDCGHLACFHNREQENLGQRYELEQLKKRIQTLEGQISVGKDEVLNKVVSRVIEMEDNLDRGREEVEAQIKGAYRNLNMAWGKIAAGDEKHKENDNQLRQVYDKLMDHEKKLRSLEDRQMELQDADLSLEERVGHLYDLLDDDKSARSAAAGDNQQRGSFMSDVVQPNMMSDPNGSRGGQTQRSPPAPHQVAAPGDASTSDSSHIRPLVVPRRPPLVSASCMEAWTVHVSLLPHASIAMPFERNTNAYQRCLSRGLHRMVVVGGTDALSFVTAVSKAFSSILRGREWMPLQAKLCDAKSLMGLPMLCQLDPRIVDTPYDINFLRNHCAVCDSSGMIDSLYIAMRYDKISWHSLKQSPVVMDGLEGSWVHDPLLDNDPYDDDTAIDEVDRPAAGDFVPFPSLKRTRSTSFGPSTSKVETQGSEAKRTCPAPTIRRRGVETT